jgi:hypothetical protein
MEDDLKVLNRRWSIVLLIEDNLKHILQMEDNINYFSMEDNLPFFLQIANDFNFLEMKMNSIFL